MSDNSKFETRLIIAADKVARLDCTNPEATTPTTTSGGVTEQDSDTICDVDPPAVAAVSYMKNGEVEYHQNIKLNYSDAR